LWEAIEIVINIDNAVVEVYYITSERIFSFNLFIFYFSNVKLGCTIKIKIKKLMIMNKKYIEKHIALR